MTFNLEKHKPTTSYQKRDGHRSPDAPDMVGFYIVNPIYFLLFYMRKDNIFLQFATNFNKKRVDCDYPHEKPI